MAAIRHGIAGAAVILALGLHALTSSAAAPTAATGSPTPVASSGIPAAANSISPTPALLGISPSVTPLGTSTPIPSLGTSTLPGMPTPTASITPTVSISPTPSATPTLPPLPPGPSATRDDRGLRLTIGLPPGPYFRSELLPVALTVVNRGIRPLEYATSCLGPLFYVSLLGGRGGLWPVGLIDFIGCGPSPLSRQLLRQGGSLVFRTLIGLPVAGRIVVEGQFVPELTHAGLATYFVAAQPSVAIIAAAKPPTGRTLAVTRRGHSVYLAGYLVSSPPAVGEEATAFVEPPTGACLPGGTLRWLPLRGGSLHDDGCRPDEHQEQWRVLIGAPGYAIFSATYCFNPVPSMVFGGLNGTPFMRDAGCTEVIHEPGR